MKVFKYVFICVLALVSYSSCKDRVNPVKCVKELQDVSKAAADYNNNQNQATCNAYAAALSSYINACSREDDFNSNYEDIYASLDCDGL